MEIFIIILLVILIGITVYYGYSALINERLIRKKQYLGIKGLKNVYSSRLKTFTSSTTVVAMVLFAVMFFPMEREVVLGFGNEENYENVVDSLLFSTDENEIQRLAQITEAKLEVSQDSKIIETASNIYIVGNDSLMSLNLSQEESAVPYLEFIYDSEETSSINVISNEDKVIVYRNCFETSATLGEIYIHRSDNLDLEEKISVNGYIEKLYIEDEYLKVFVRHKIKTSDFSTNQVKLFFEKANKQVAADVDDTYYISGGMIKQSMTIARINLESYRTKVETFYTSDCYLTIDEGKAYLLCNLPSKNTYLPKSIILEYNTNRMKMIGERVFGGTVYHEAIISENNDILLCIVREKSESNQYSMFLLDDSLEIVSSKVIELKKEEYLGATTSFNYIASDIKDEVAVTALNEETDETQEFSINNNTLRIGKIINGKIIQINAIDNKLYMISYSKDDISDDTELFTSDEAIITFKLANFFVDDNNLRLIYETDSKIGYLRFSLENEVQLLKSYTVDRDDEESVIFTDNHIVIIKDGAITLLNSDAEEIFTHQK
ncbi:MAG: hypothetical protein PHO86_03535 [Bacilli bacterium]|nr:hypothetical protein [Bacilli bacterium]